MFYIVIVLCIAFGALSFGIVSSNFVLARRTAKKDWKIAKNKDYKPKVSIIVPTYNESEVIGYKLRNLSKLAYPDSLMQIVFIDSHSSDGTVDKIRDFAKDNSHVNIQLIVENERKGKSFALNTALKNCTGDVIIVSDADCFWPSGILDNSLCYFAEPSVGAISGPKKLLNVEESWVTRNESRYLESMNLMKLGESKTHSTIFFEGGFAAFSKPLLDAFDPYDTGSDDCGTVIGILEQDKRALMVPEAEFYTFFPKSWKGKTDIKVRRAVQLVRVLHNYSTLLFKGRLKTVKKLIIKNILLYVFAPMMFLFFTAMIAYLMLTFPPALLLLSIFLIPGVNIYLFEAISSFLTMWFAVFLVALRRKSLLWKKPEDRKSVVEQPLAEAGLI